MRGVGSREMGMAWLGAGSSFERPKLRKRNVFPSIRELGLKLRGVAVDGWAREKEKEEEKLGRNR